MYPLDCIKVLDLSRVLAGPYCTQTLGDLGAEVWKIEEPRNGDDTRGWSPPEVHGQSSYYLCCNRNKLSVAVDFKSDEGRAELLRLADEADVLIENFRIGTLERYGLGYEQLRRRNPRLVYCSISGYGRTGPRAQEAGYDFVIQAESGLMAITGEVEGEPVKLGVAVADLITGMNATQAILAALIAREKTGAGQLIDISLMDCAVALLANVASAHLATGADSKRYGNAHATVVPYQLFQSADAAFVLAVGNDSQFHKLCRTVLGRPDISEDARFTTNRDRVVNRDALIPLLAEIFLTRDTATWLAELGAAGIPSGKVRQVSEVFASPEVEARGMLRTAVDAEGREYRLVGSPLHFSATPVRPPSAPPRLGEHTERVLGRPAE